MVRPPCPDAACCFDLDRDPLTWINFCSGRASTLFVYE